MVDEGGEIVQSSMEGFGQSERVLPEDLVVPAGDKSIPRIPDHREFVVVVIVSKGVSDHVRLHDVECYAVRLHALQKGAGPVLGNSEPDEPVLVTDRQVVLA